MSEDPLEALNRRAAELAAQDALPYDPQPGQPSMLAGLGNSRMWEMWETREDRLAKPIRATTLNWLTRAVAFGCDATYENAREALLFGIPNGGEHVLDGGAVFIFVVDQAAIMLGALPDDVRLSPRRLHS